MSKKKYDPENDEQNRSEDFGAEEPAESSFDWSSNESVETRWPLAEVDFRQSVVESAHRSEQVQVRLLNHDPVNGKYIAASVKDPSDVRMIPKQHLRRTLANQNVDYSIFNSSERPYNWEEEISRFRATRASIQTALWREGYADKKELSSKQFFAILMKHGLLPEGD